MGVRVKLAVAVTLLVFSDKAWTSEDPWIANDWPEACKQAFSSRPPKPIFVVFR